jgi:uncharacterized protein (TIGR00369 family)
MKSSDLRVSPFQNFLGVELIMANEDSVVIRLPERHELQRGPGEPQFHGGVVGALIDIAGSYAVESAVGGDAPTADLRVDYLRPASGVLTATARVVKRGRTLCVADVEVRDSEERLVAIGRGSFMNTAAPDVTAQKGRLWNQE